MRNSHLIGMWRFASTKKLCQNINRVLPLKLAFKLNPDHEELRCDCATENIQKDCPFYCKINKIPETKNVTHLCNHLCLAPRKDKEWSSFQDENYRAKWYSNVIGCYILSFCERGYENYLRMKAWQRRQQKSRNRQLEN